MEGRDSTFAIFSLSTSRFPLAMTRLPSFTYSGSPTTFTYSSKFLKISLLIILAFFLRSSLLSCFASSSLIADVLSLPRAAFSFFPLASRLYDVTAKAQLPPKIKFPIIMEAMSDDLNLRICFLRENQITVI